jgi:hypothetical protein
MQVGCHSQPHTSHDSKNVQTGHSQQNNALASILNFILLLLNEAAAIAVKLYVRAAH